MKLLLTQLTDADSVLFFSQITTEFSVQLLLLEECLQALDASMQRLVGADVLFTGGFQLSNFLLELSTFLL